MPPPQGTNVLSISQLTTQVKELLEGRFDQVWIEGEVTNFVKAASGHCYFSLKDSGAIIRCAMFRGVAMRVRFDVKNGMEVVAFGRVSVYPQKGDYQFYVEQLQPKGIGALELAFQQLKDRLRAKSYFLAARKKPLPRFPRRIALITSPIGSAVRDMIETCRHRWPALELVVAPSRVQGDGASTEIAAQIRRLNDLHARGVLVLDAIVLGRGGGSLEDLWAFNEESVADAIFFSKIPVVSGIGHEDDVTIADLVADLRALTPTDAIQRLAPHTDETRSELSQLLRRMREATRGRAAMARQRLDGLSRRASPKRMLNRLTDMARRLDDKSEQLRKAAMRRTERSRRRLEALAGKLEALSPLNILGRGYSLTRKTSETSCLRSTLGVRVGDSLETRLAEGSVHSIVTSVEPGPQGGER